MSTIVDVTTGKVVMNSLVDNNVVVPPSSNIESPEMAEEDDLKTPTVEELAFPGQKVVCSTRHNVSDSRSLKIVRTSLRSQLNEKERRRPSMS